MEISMINVIVEPDSSVSTVISYGLDSRAVVVRLSLRGKNFFALQKFCTVCGTHLASLSKCRRSFSAWPFKGYRRYSTVLDDQWTQGP